MYSIVLRPDSHEALDRTLTTLADQSVGSWEVIVPGAGAVAVPDRFPVLTNTGKSFRRVGEDATNPSVALNLGVEAAEGEWVLFPEPGAWFTPQLLENLAETIAADPS